MGLKDEAYERQPGRTVGVCALTVQGQQLCYSSDIGDYRQLKREYLAEITADKRHQIAADRCSSAQPKGYQLRVPLKETSD